MSTSALSALLTVLKDRILQGPKTRSQKTGLYALLTILFLIARYPDRAIGTRARPDLKLIEWGGSPLIGNTYMILKTRETFLQTIVENFALKGNQVM